MIAGPKSTRSTLDVVNNTYVVRNGLLYEYYPISTKESKPGDRFIKLEISPGVITPGIAIVDKQLYDVSVEDLFRRRINVEKRHERSEAGATTGKSDATAKKAKNISKPKTSSNEQGSGTLFGVEVSKTADMAWENQVDTLLQAFLAKEGEEFEITGSTQSGRSDESRSNADLFHDIKLD